MDGRIGKDATAATLYYDTAFVTGNSGNALDFDGTGDYAVIDNSATTTIDDDITIALWVKGSSQAGYNRLAGNKTAGDGIDVNVKAGSSTVAFNISTSGGTYQSFDLDNVLDNTWHHIAITLDNGTAAAYLDGSQVTSVTCGTSYSHGNGFGNSNDWVLGADTDYDQEFDGALVLRPANKD